jgi:foldase protein PrsA
VLLFASIAAVLVVLSPFSFSQPAPARPAPPPPPPALATVNGEAVTRGDWDRSLKEAYGAKALRELIEERLILQEAHRLRITVIAAEIEQRIAHLKTEYPDDAAFQAMLDGRGIALEELKSELKRDRLLDKMVDQMAGVTDDQVAQYYRSHAGEFSQPTRVHLYTITTDDTRAAYVAAERLAKGEDFAKVAAELSKDEVAAKGGDRGWVAAEEVKPAPVRVAAFALEPGTRSEPIQAEGQVYVLWVKERQPGSVVALADARDRIAARLRAEKGVTRKAVLTGLLRRATVKVTDPRWASVAAELDRMKQIQVVVDGKPLALAHPPYSLPSGRIMVPAKPLLTAIGATMRWWPKTNTLQIKGGDREVWLSPGSEIAVINGKDKVKLDQPPVMREGTLYASPRWLVEQFGGTVVWSAEENTIKVTSAKAAPGTNETFPAPTKPSP